MSKIETNTIDNISGSSTLTIGDSNTSTITLKSGATLTNFPDNTPFTTAKKDSDQTISHGTETKITFDSVVNESSSGIFDLTNNKFTVVTAGTYLIFPQLRIYDSDNRLERAECRIFKNGTKRKVFMYFDNGYSSSNSREVSLGSGYIEDLVADDYIEMYGYAGTNDSGSVVAESDHIGTCLGVMKIIT